MKSYFFIKKFNKKFLAGFRYEDNFISLTGITDNYQYAKRYYNRNFHREDRILLIESTKQHIKDNFKGWQKDCQEYLLQYYSKVKIK